MKQQLLLKTEMVPAFKMGDKDTFARLQRRLEPDPKNETQLRQFLNPLAKDVYTRIPSTVQSL